MRMRTKTLAAAAALLASSLAAPAQTDKKADQGIVRESTGATVIEIPVNVLGKDGMPLAGLTKADFEIYDNGKKQTISGFEVVDMRQKTAATPAPSAANPFQEPPPAVARRHWLLAFDLSYATPTGLIRARTGAREFVQKQMGASDLAAVANLSVEHGWNLVENFTTDRDQLSHAIDTLGLIKPNIRTNDPLAFAFEQPGRNAGLSNSAHDDAVREQIADLQRLQVAASDDRERGRITQHMNSLGQMARTLDAVRGTKHVLLFSEGFESRMVNGNAGTFNTSMDGAAPTQESNAEAAIRGETWKIDGDARFGSSASRNNMTMALSVFRRSDVVLDTIDISGLRAEADTTRKPGSGTDALFTMASETNGDFIRNANQLSGSLQQLIDRTALIYIVAFQPGNLSKPGAFHELKVKVNAPTSKVAARSGYYEPRPYAKLTPIERVLASGDLLTSGAAGAEIPVRMIAAPFASDAAVAQVPIVLEIPGKQLIQGETAAASPVEIYAYASDANGTLTDFLTQQLSLDLKRVKDRLEAGGIKYYGTLFLPPGHYTVRALVRNVSTGRSALNSLPLQVPAIPGSAPTVLPPFFQDSADRWLMVKSNPRADAASHRSDYPFALGSDSFIPAALGVVHSGATAQVTVVTYNLGSPGGGEPLQVLPEVLGPEGKPRKVDVQVIKRSDQQRDGSRALQLALNPQGLEAGRYELKVRVSDRVSRKTAEASSGFEVRTP